MRFLHLIEFLLQPGGNGEASPVSGFATGFQTLTTWVVGVLLVLLLVLVGLAMFGTPRSGRVALRLLDRCFDLAENACRGRRRSPRSSARRADEDHDDGWDDDGWDDEDWDDEDWDHEDWHDDGASGGGR
jgi:hypothetical protein